MSCSRKGSVSSALGPLRALLLLFTVCICISAVAGIPSVPVESFSLSAVEHKTDDTVLELVAALESKCIIAIRDVPEYAALRKRFLSVATHCVASSPAGIQSKTLRDGTRRTTISTQTQYNNPQLAKSAVEKDCAEYMAVLRAFSELLNTVAATLARTIDTALKSPESHAKSASKLEEIVKQAHHLDHFHSYTSPSSADNKPVEPSDDGAQTEEAVLSLDLHTDNGVMILMTTPEFYSLQGETPQRVSRDQIKTGPTASAGLLIKQPRQQHVVQPVLKDDELIVMIGEGYRSWMYSKLDFKPVLHGMQMPQFSQELGKISRSWFGKMILLPKTHEIKSLGITFEEYSHRATAYVMGHKGTEGFSAVACPPNSKLVESDKACALKLYEPLPDSQSSSEECNLMCNTHSDEECQALCQYVATVPSGGVDCWMLCLPNDVCGSDEVAQCDPTGKQQTVCVAAKAQ